MAKISRSARGEVVDFDLLAIKSALVSTPATVHTNQRRSFIDKKGSKKTVLENYVVTPQIPAKTSDALSVALDGAEESAKASTKSKK